MTGMEIVDFRPDLRDAFRWLNEAWITEYFALEPKDVRTLANPAGEIVAKGGRILFVMEDGAAVGCCALLVLADGDFELAKMAVATAQRGRGCGRALMAAAIDQARALGAARLYLETNSRLATALSLYRAFGFREVEFAKPSEFTRADVAMELLL
jgi:putative acetyltransferase